MQHFACYQFMISVIDRRTTVKLRAYEIPLIWVSINVLVSDIAIDSDSLVSSIVTLHIYMPSSSSARYSKLRLLM